MNRTKNSIRNIIFTIIGSIVITVVQLVNRRVFVNFLAEDYLGLNGLFHNIISVLSVSEMGIGTAMIFALYKPVADGDKEKIKSLMALYKKLYTTIGLFVLIVGTGLTPFLSVFIKEMPDISYIHLYYVMYVIDAGMSYFYTYKRSIIICNQEDYISSTTTMISSVATRLVQLLVLVLTHNFFLYLLVQILFTRLENIVISKIAERKYPYLKDKEVKPLDKEDVTSIKKNILAMMTTKVGSVLVSGTDNLIISKILGLTIVGLYSNYMLLINTLNSLIGKVFNAITASVGNLVVKKSEDEVEGVFYNILFANYAIYNVAAIGFWCLLQPFVRLWLNDKMLLSDASVWIFVAVFYVNGMRLTVLTFRNAVGMFWHDRYRAILEAVVNLGLSIPLTFMYGIVGVKLGSLIALLVTTFWVEGYILYKNYFKKSFKKYILRQGGYAAITLLECMAIDWICRSICVEGILGFIIQGVVCVALFGILIILIFGRTREFKYYWGFVKKILKR